MTQFQEIIHIPGDFQPHFSNLARLFPRIYFLFCQNWKTGACNILGERKKSPCCFERGYSDLDTDSGGRARSNMTLARRLGSIIPWSPPKVQQNPFFHFWRSYPIHFRVMIGLVLPANPSDIYACRGRKVLA